jgi:hypothetical protein
MRRLSKLAWFAIATHAAAATCIVAVLVKWQSGGIEGAYFNRYVTSFDPVPWLAAALALLIVGTVALIAAAGRRAA